MDENIGNPKKTKYIITRELQSSMTDLTKSDFDEKRVSWKYVTPAKITWHVAPDTPPFIKPKYIIHKSNG
jgi:hypothetical protein